MRSRALLEVRGLWKRYGSLWAVRGLNLEVRSGEVVGLLGPNGAGKTTTLRAICGLIAIERGEVRILGETITGIRRHALRYVGYLPEELDLYPWLTVEEQLWFIGRLRGAEELELQERVRELLAFFELEEYSKRLTMSLSRGYRQRLGLAVALVHDPPLLLLDEPVQAMDPVYQRKVAQLLRKLADAGKGVLVSTHMLSFAAKVCDHVVLLQEGKTVFSGSLQELYAAYNTDDLEEAFVRAVAASG